MSNTTITTLPQILHTQIYSFLDSRSDVDSLSRTCRSLNAASKDDAIWELYRHTIPGFPVSKETAQTTYNALGKDCGKQFIDGKYQKLHGDRVFESGAHGKPAEPGYYDSALNAFHCASVHIGEPFTVELYWDVHRTACAHFLGAVNETLMRASEAGKWRSATDEKISYVVPLAEALIFLDRADKKDESRRDLIREYVLFRSLFSRFGMAPDTDKYKECEALLCEKFPIAFDEELQKLRQDPHFGKALPTGISLNLQDGAFVIQYASPSDETFSFQEVIPHVLSEFNRCISEIDEELLRNGPHDRRRDKELIDQKLTLIYDLYRKLEWLHPFQDGQGRTDLICLGKLLAENGFTPAILDEPYVSSYAPFADGIQYLKEGMAQWQQTVSARTSD